MWPLGPVMAEGGSMPIDEDPWIARRRLAAYLRNLREDRRMT